MIVKVAVTENGYALEYAAEHLRANKEIVKAAGTDGYATCALEYAVEHLKADRDIVMAAVTADGGALLLYAAEDLKGDREMVKKAIKVTGFVLQYDAGHIRL